MGRVTSARERAEAKRRSRAGLPPLTEEPCGGCDEKKEKKAWAEVVKKPTVTVVKKGGEEKKEDIEEVEL